MTKGCQRGGGSPFENVYQVADGGVGGILLIGSGSGCGGGIGGFAGAICL